MEYVIRPARADDKSAVLAFTRDTFSWGDYVPSVFDSWITDPTGTVLVVETDGAVVAMARGAMLSAREAWFQGARVHPEWRRRGIGLALYASLTDWARAEGADVARLLVEEANKAALHQVEATGMRQVARFLRAVRSVGEASPAPSGNGGRRVGALEKLRREHSSAAQPAFMSWSTGELARAARGLFAVGWQFRRLTMDDLLDAGAREALWSARSGWVLAARRDQALEVGWLETAPGDALDLMRAIVDLAVDEGADSLQVILPDVEWITQAARRANYQIEGERLFALGL